MNREIDINKSRYFVAIGLQNRDVLALHKNNGLWEREPGERKRSWGNVTEHCLVVAARVEVLADLVNLSQDAKNDLIDAAMVHDFYKKREKLFYKENPNLTLDQLRSFGEESEQLLIEVGLNQRVKALATCLSDDKLPEVEKRAKKEKLTEDDLCFMIIHYVDDYTMGSNWVTPASEDKNDLERRIDKLEGNADYSKLNDSIRLYDGLTAFQAQRNVSRMIQARLTELVNFNQREVTEPKYLPEIVDNEIRNRINNI